MHCSTRHLRTKYWKTKLSNKPRALQVTGAFLSDVFKRGHICKTKFSSLPWQMSVCGRKSIFEQFSVLLPRLSLFAQSAAHSLTHSLTSGSTPHGWLCTCKKGGQGRVGWHMVSSWKGVILYVYIIVPLMIWDKSPPTQALDGSIF